MGNRLRAEAIDTKRRSLLKFGATAVAVVGVAASGLDAFSQQRTQPPHPPMALGLLIKPFPTPEAKIALVRELGFRTCFLSLTAISGSSHRRLQHSSAPPSTSMV